MVSVEEAQALAIHEYKKWSYCRPNKRIIFSANGHQYSMRVDLLKNGCLHHQAGKAAHGWYSLSGITFVTKAARHHKISGRDHSWVSVSGIEFAVR